MLNLNEVFSFIEVAKAQGFSEASRKTGLPKSTLSRHVQNLEERLAINLFQRSTRRLKLTPAGESFFRKAHSLAVDLESLERQFQSQSQKVEGLIRLTSSVEGGVYLLPRVLKSFKELYPGVDFDLHLSDETTNLIDAKIDVALRGGALQDSSFICRRIFDSSFKLYTHPELVASVEKTWKHNRDEIPLIDFTTKPFSQMTFVTKGKRFRFTQPPKYVSNSLRMSAELASLKLGVCALPQFIGEGCMQHQRALAPVLKDLEAAAGSLYVVYVAQAHLPRRVRLFIDHLIKELSH